jgi:hypothetical protein
MHPWRIRANWPALCLIWEHGDCLQWSNSPQMAGFFANVSGFHVSGALGGWGASDHIAEIVPFISDI